MRHRLPALLLLLMTAVCAVHARQWTAPIQQELSNATVSALAEDQDGYLWIGTRRGLNRYNGSSYKVFWQGDSSALSSDRILSLYPDTDHRLWVGTDTGLNLIRNSQVVWQAPPRFYPISAIAGFDEGHLILGSHLGLLLYDKESHESSLLLQDMTYPKTILVTPQKKILASARAGQPEVVLLDHEFNLVSRFMLPGVRRIAASAVSPDGRIFFFATDRGLLAYSEDMAELPHWGQALEKACGETNPNVLFVSADPYSGMLVAGVESQGLFSINPDSGEIRKNWYDINLTDAGSAAFLPAKTHFWFSTEQFPLYSRMRHNEQTSLLLRALAPEDAVIQILPYDETRILVQSSYKILLVDIVTAATRDLSPKGSALQRTAIRTCRLDREKRPWIVLKNTALQCFDISAGTAVLLGSWPVGNCSALWENEDGSISFIDDGRLHTVSEGVLSSRPLSRSGEYWRVMPTASGRNYFIDGEKIYLFSRDGQFYPLPLSIPSPKIISEDETGRIWIGTFNAGVFRYDPQTRALKNFTVSDGLPDNSIQAFAFNGRGTWISHRNQISHINGNDQIMPVTLNNSGQVSFVSGAAASGADGRVIFAGQRQLQEIMPQSYAAPVRIPATLDGLLVNNEEYPLPGEKVVLDWKKNLIVFYFSAINFEYGQQLSYAYQLEGRDRQWVQSGQDTRAFYSNLSSGNYTFRVRLQTPDGIWHEDQTLLRLRINPAPWLSLPAKLAYVLLSLGLLALLAWLYRRNRSSQERAERAELERDLDEQLNRDKTDFFMNISHEYRTPLSLIYGPARDLARNNDLNEHDRHLVRLIERNAEKMMTLTEQVVNFNKFSRSSDRLAVLQTDLSAKLSETADHFDYVREQRGMTLRKELPADLSVWCDRDKVKKIFFNLLSNAFKYTPDGGTITVSAARRSAAEARRAYPTLPESAYEGPYAEISVTDTGVGIDQDKIDRIFQRFERLGAKVGDKEPEGLGIGLNHVLYLVGVLRGAIKVEPGRVCGSVFSFVIPAGKEAYAKEELWHEIPVEATGKLLIVEDNAEMRSYLNDLFKDTANVLLASDGDDALRFIRISAPDLVISDVMMPYKDGFQLCREIKESPEYSHLPVILLTAKNEKADQLEGLGAGADAYLQKPFDPAILQSTVRNLLDNRRRIQKALKGQDAGGIGQVLPELPVGTHDKAFLQKIFALVEEHLSEEEFNVSSLAGMMGMSRSGLFSKVKALTGQSPQEFLSDYRLSRARELLLTHDYNISEVAYKVGFSTLNGLSRAFKNKYGVPPSSL